MEKNGNRATAARVGLILLLAASLAACGRGTPGSVPEAEEARASPGTPGAPAVAPPASSTPPAAAIFEYRYTSVRIEDPGAVRYRAEFRFHPDGTIRSAELREIRAGAETPRASVVSEPFQGGYRVVFRSFGRDPGGYDYVLGWSETGLSVTAGGEATGFRFDPAGRVFTIPWDRGAETYSPGPDGSVLGELVLSGERQWSGRLFQSGGSLRFEDRYPDGSVDRECDMKPSGPGAWSVSCTGSADSFYEGTLTGTSLFPRGGVYPASAFNLILVTDLWMTEERFPFFCLSLLE
jgi:predicted small lipoprotein YifL